MIESLKVSNYIVFENETFAFSPGLNVILGENSTGKSLLMKLAYSCAAVSHSMGKGDRKSKDELQRVMADKLKDVCMPDSLGRLVTRKQGRSRCEVAIQFKSESADAIKFSFSSNSDKEVKLESTTPSRWLEAAPVFLPTKELLSIFPNFASTLRERHLSFDGTYLDLADSLGIAVLRKLRKEEQELRESLEATMRGKVIYENNRFYLLPDSEGKGKIEMPLIAEGIRKIALLTYLVMNGELRNKSLLFWDEPEVNLNPKLMQALAEALIDLTEKGVQIVLATHSLYLLRELTIARSKKSAKVPARFIALALEDDVVKVSQGDRMEDVDPIASLDAELEQGDRYMELP
jgi:AAA15 family ATPase/GTPase